MISSVFTISALAALAIAIPHPQAIDFARVEAAPAPGLETAPLDVQIDTPVLAPVPVAGPIAPIPAVVKRDTVLQKRDGDCALQPAGSGPVATNDTVDAFMANPAIQSTSNNAVTPDGYSQVFKGLRGSMSASRYMGLYTLTSYDTLKCASACDQASGCVAFNIYVERDPSLDPNAVSCPNPPSTTNYKCTLWGAPLSSSQATNLGQWRDNFQVVIAGSNAYNKAAPPAAIDGFSGPTEFGGAIDVPASMGTQIGSSYYPFSKKQGYSPSTCAQACTATNKSKDNKDNKRDNTATATTSKTCAFFDAYVLSKNGTPQGLYCLFYTQAYSPSYATNYGSTSGSDSFTVSQSYGYALVSTSNSKSD